MPVTSQISWRNRLLCFRNAQRRWTCFMSKIISLPSSRNCASIGRKKRMTTLVLDRKESVRWTQARRRTQARTGYLKVSSRRRVSAAKMEAAVIIISCSLIRRCLHRSSSTRRKTKRWKWLNWWIRNQMSWGTLSRPRIARHPLTQTSLRSALSSKIIDLRDQSLKIKSQNEWHLPSC